MIFFSLRFGRKKNIYLLFVFIIPENFEGMCLLCILFVFSPNRIIDQYLIQIFLGCLSGHGADITLIEPLTMEKLSIVAKYWKTYFSNTGE